MKISSTSAIIIKTIVLILCIVMLISGLIIILSEPLPNREVNLLHLILLKLFGFSFVFISIAFFKYIFKKK